MQQNKGYKLRAWPYYLIAFAAVLALSLLGVALFTNRISKDVARALLFALLGLYAAWYLFNLSHMAKQRKTPPNRKEVSDKIRAMRDAGDSILPVLEKKLKKACFMTDLVMAGHGLWILAVSLFSYALPGLTVVIIYVFAAFLMRLVPPKAENSNTVEPLNEREYEELYSLAQKAQAAVGGSRKISIILVRGCHGAVTLYKNIARLILGAELLQCFSRDEVYQIMLHEFAHLEDEKHFRYIRHAERIQGNWGITDQRESEAFGYYDLFMSQKREKQADSIILKKGDPQVAANCFAKLRCHQYYLNDFIASDTKIISYMPEQPPKAWISFLCQDFQKAVEMNEDFAMELIFKELRPKVDSHPIARDRIAAMGISEIFLSFPRHEGAWAELCKKALQWADKDFYECIRENYQEAREERYLKPVRCIAQWKASEQILSYESTRDVLEAMFTMYQFADIVSLSESFSATGASENERCHAMFYEGLSRLRLRDHSGIQVLQNVCRVNGNYYDAAMEAVGEYCLTMGLEEEMENHRQFYRDMEIDYFDHMDIFPLTARDNLAVSDLPECLRRENMAMISAAGGEYLETVYLVKKAISQQCIRHIYILKLRKGITADMQGQIYDRVFRYLDKQEEHYALVIWEEADKWIEKHPEYKEKPVP